MASVDDEASLAVRLAGVASLAVRTAGAPSLAVVVSALVAVVDSVLGVAGADTSSADTCAPPKTKAVPKRTLAAPKWYLRTEKRCCCLYQSIDFFFIWNTP